MRTLVGVFALELALACGGGGGGGNGNNGTAPTISNLQYSPGTATLNQGGGTILLTGTLAFSDPDGDITTLRLTTEAGNLDNPIQGIGGVTSGTLDATFSVATSQLGHFAFQVSLLDGRGHQSNSLPGTFDVVPDDSATHWTPRSAPSALSAEQFWGVAWSGTRYVAVGTHGAIMRSSDGATWTQSASPVTVDLYRATWAGTQFVAVGDQGTILTSPDGTTWTTRHSSGVPGNILYGVAWSGSRIVAVGVSPTAPWTTAIALSSPNGDAWTPSTTPANMDPYDSQLSAVTSSGALFVAVGSGAVTEGTYGQGLVWTSVDGLTWSASSPGTNALSTVVWGAGKYVASGSGSPLTSPDGITWTPVANPWAGYEVAWSGAHFLSLLNIHTANLYPSDLAASGTVQLNLPGIWYGHGQLIWGRNEWVCPGTPGTIWTSP